MEIKKLQLKNFRNYLSEDIFFSKNVSIIYGENAQGKTNIIEALYLLSTGKSFRTNNTNELIRHGESFFSICLELEENNYPQTIEIRYEKGNGKKLFINEIKKDRMSDILGVAPSVLFSPESLTCIKGSPGERRKLIDIVLCQISKKYLHNLQNYNKIVKNKNMLLKQIQANKQHKHQLDVWTESQAKTGSVIIELRKLFIDSIEKRIKRLMLGISDGKENVDIRYKSFYEDGKDIYQYLLNTMIENTEKEIEYGISLYGPHRDEMEISLNNKNSRLYCSQGQQRSLALALNIAIMEEIEQNTGRKPVLLLDDVMSELDENRRNFLYEIIEKTQTVITTTERMQFVEIDDNRKIKHIHIKEGTAEYDTII